MLAGITRFSLRVIVGESAGSIAIGGDGLSAVALAKADDPGLFTDASVTALPRSTPAATEAGADSFAAVSNCSANAGSLVTIVPNSWPISTVSPILVFHSPITPANDD